MKSKNNFIQNRTIIIIIFMIVVVIAIFFMFFKQNGYLPKTVINVSDKEFEVMMTADVHLQLSKAYRDSRVEYLYCLDGKLNDKNIVINEAIPVEAFNVGRDHLTYDAGECRGTLGTLHNHLSSSHCNPSNQDYYSWGRLDPFNFKLHIVQCKYTDHVFIIPGDSTVIQEYPYQITII